MTFKKQIMSLIFLSLLLCVQLPAYAQIETVKINLPQFPITINGLEIENNRLEYPMIVYNDITYFPMTYQFSNGLGLNTHFDVHEGFSIAYAAANSNPFTVSYLDFAPLKRDLYATLPSYPIEVNNVMIQNENEIYPLLTYKEITYFPMTWRFAVEDFGWQYTFDMHKGLEIKVANSASPDPKETVADTTQEAAPILPNSNVILNALDDSVPLPESYSTYRILRDDGKSFFQRNQGNSSTCWAFAANTLFELSLAKQKQVYLDLSEDHLILNTPFKVNYDSGGNMEVAYPYYNNWTGPVVDPEDTFGDGKTNTDLKPDYIMTDYVTIENSVSTIKRAVYEYGAVFTAIGYDDSKKYYSNTTYGFYNNNYYSDPTHAIVIVGWDDHYSKLNFLVPPKSNGAFIVQNSWGDDWGENGFFYVSYEDVHISEKATAIAAISNRKENQKQYYYDETGTNRLEGYSDHYQATGLNVFNSSPAKESDSEYITTIGFYTSFKDSKFKISYADSSVPESGFLDLTEIASGVAKLPGYHTIKLEHPIKLTPDHPFSIAVTYENDDSIFLLPLEGPYPGIDYTVTGNLNESYISPNPDHDGFEDIGIDHPESNVCIRVITEFK
ncbi:C1 family peptidase [Fusibacter ferrireducens]|uniref:Peptidase C1A papain C-terminal domain-containing protein n=1 Tax=Fusibacter ferrireducens TaxID=2785058 RepID=A0ABR9ZQT1_9FIRM|nr:lectin like domain-containing protein [Fusibacter ferrireducens]MBF4692804.1 hypothetical protein [Fusibacter ferrireducens]